MSPSMLTTLFSILSLVSSCHTNISFSRSSTDLTVVLSAMNFPSDIFAFLKLSSSFFVYSGFGTNSAISCSVFTSSFSRCSGMNSLISRSLLAEKLSSVTFLNCDVNFIRDLKSSSILSRLLLSSSIDTSFNILSSSPAPSCKI